MKDLVTSDVPWDEVKTIYKHTLIRLCMPCSYGNCYGMDAMDPF